MDNSIVATSRLISLLENVPYHPFWQWMVNYLRSHQLSLEVMQTYRSKTYCLWKVSDLYSGRSVDPLLKVSNARVFWGFISFYEGFYCNHKAKPNHNFYDTTFHIHYPIPPFPSKITQLQKARPYLRLTKKKGDSWKKIPQYN